MLFEVLSTVSMAAIAGSSYYFQNKNAVNDHDKIKKIADTAGLKTSEGSIRIYRKVKNKNYTEYVYKIPLGLSFAQFEEKKQLFIDGLNNKSQSDINLSNFKNIDWKGDVVNQVKDIFNNRIRLDKQIEMEYDGMLRIRVFEKGLDSMYPYNEGLLSKDWKVSIGYTYKDLITHDFEKRPHMIVAGATGFGKSEFLKLLISVLIQQQSKQLRLHLIDLKGGNELGPFKSLNQTYNFSREPIGAKKVLKEIQEDMNAKLDYLFERGVNSVGRLGQKERDFIFIDEAADLDDESRDIVVDIARRGRSAGYRLIYATQYPTNETLPSQVRANIGARVCFRLETNTQSRAVLDEGGAEGLPEIEGRAIFRRVKNYVVQTPYIGESEINRIIKPYIVKEDDYASGKTKAIGTGREHIVIVEEAGLSNKKTTSSAT